MSKHPNIDETLDKLTELAHNQQKALECANEIISMKNRMIMLCEQETGLYKKEVISLQKTVFWLSVCLGASIVLSLLSYVL